MLAIAVSPSQRSEFLQLLQSRRADSDTVREKARSLPRARLLWTESSYPVDTSTKSHTIYHIQLLKHCTQHPSLLHKASAGCYGCTAPAREAVTVRASRRLDTMRRPLPLQRRSSHEEDKLTAPWSQGSPSGTPSLPRRTRREASATARDCAARGATQFCRLRLALKSATF